MLGIIRFYLIYYVFRSKVPYNTLALSSPNFVFPLRNGQETTIKNSLPAISLKLNDLAEKLQACYQLTTQGRFSDAINRFRQILLNIPFLIVNSKQEVIFFLIYAFF